MLGIIPNKEHYGPISYSIGYTLQIRIIPNQLRFFRLEGRRWIYLTNLGYFQPIVHEILLSICWIYLTNWGHFQLNQVELVLTQCWTYLTQIGAIPNKSI
jgi:hypothetical protein